MFLCLLAGKSYTYLPIFQPAYVYLFTYDSHPHRIIGGIYGICIEIEKKRDPDMLLPIKYRIQIRLDWHSIMNIEHEYL